MIPQQASPVKRNRPQQGKRRAPVGALLFGRKAESYWATVWQKRMRMVAICARVALPAGRRVSSSKPWIRPWAQAQAMGIWAYAWMVSASE